MPTDDEIHNDLLAMYSRLGAIEGKVNVIGRANSGPIRAVLEDAVRSQPLIGQIYLLLNGTRTQKESVGRAIVKRVAQVGEVNARRLTEDVPSTFLERNGVAREAVAAAIERAVGGRVPTPEGASATIVIADNRYQVNLGAGARITRSN